MPRPIKYSPTTTSGSYQKGNVAIGTNPIAYDSTWVNSPVISNGTFVVTEAGAVGVPKFYSPTTTDEWIRLAKQEGATGANTGSINAVKSWFASQANYDVANIELPLGMPNIVGDGLVLNLDAGINESYPSSGTTWTDLSGVGNNGTLTNGPTFNSDNGGSILFDGVDDYAVTSPTNFTANNDFTYEIIVKSNQYIQSRGIFGNKGYWMAGQGAVIGNISSPQTIYGYVTTNTGHFDINSNVGPTYGWTNVVMRRSNNDLRFFINGNHQGSTRTISGTVTDLSDKFWLGSYVIGVQAVTPWLGNMAISRVYNRALTSSEILQNYYQAPIVTDGLVYAIDASNLVSYESGSITSYSLTGSNTGYLRYGTEFTSNNGGTFKFGTNRNTTVQAVSASNYTSSPINLPGYGSYSINVWVKRTAFGTWKSGNTNYDGIWNYYWDHNLAFTGEHTGINGIYGTGLNAYAINMNQWYNIMVTHKDYSIQNTNNHKTYLNGVLISTATITNPTLDGGLPKRFYIGNWDTSWSMVGEMANFQVYNKELSVAEIDQNFNAYRGKFGV